jgi:hypothetical protein
MSANPPNTVLSFTGKYSGLSRRLESKVFVFAHKAALAPDADISPAPTIELDSNFDGLWDTGATGSVVTQAVVDRLNLVPVKWGQVSTPKGEYPTPFYYVDMGLPNQVMVGPLLVAEGELSGFDVLIGMDVICCGDFAVSNYNGQTTFTFRMPSIKTTDYVKETNVSNIIGQKHGKGKRKKKR